MSKFKQSVVSKLFIKKLISMKTHGIINSYSEFANKLNYSPQSLNEILKGRRDVTIDVLRKLFTFYKVSPLDIFNESAHDPSIQGVDSAHSNFQNLTNKDTAENDEKIKNLEKHSASLESLLSAKDQQIESLERIIQAKDELLMARERMIKDKEEALKNKEELIAAHKQHIKELSKNRDLMEKIGLTPVENTTTLDKEGLLSSMTSTKKIWAPQVKPDIRKTPRSK